MVNNFRADQLREHVSPWESLSSDPFILDAIKHYHIEFESEVPYQAQTPRHIYSSLSDKEVIDGEISKLLLKGVIEKTCHTGNGFVSNVFVRPKKDGTYRMILNLRSLNEFVDFQHFKMDNILTALKLMRPKCFMASVDLKDAYYSVPIASEDRTFLNFEWEGNYYQYTCLPNAWHVPLGCSLKSLNPFMLTYTLWAMSVWSILTIHFLWDILAVPANKTSKTQSNVFIVLGLLFTQKNRC